MGVGRGMVAQDTNVRKVLGTVDHDMQTMKAELRSLAELAKKVALPRPPSPPPPLPPSSLSYPLPILMLATAHAGGVRLV